MPAEPNDADNVADLLQALDDLPQPLEPLDASAIDGLLAGVVLQMVPLAKVWRFIVDPEGRSPAVTPDEPSVRRLLNVLESRHRRLDRAIEQRRWFDPWVFEGDEPLADPVRAACAPWAAGFALAMEHAPGLMAADDPSLVDALALIYVHFEPDDLEDADELIAAIEALEPARDLSEAVEDLVTATLRLADISRPQSPAGRATPSGSKRSGSAGIRRRPRR